MVSISKDYTIKTLFDFPEIPEDSIYYEPMKALDKKVREGKIENVFYETLSFLYNQPWEKNVDSKKETFLLGFPKSRKVFTQEECDKFGVVVPGEVYIFYNFCGEISKEAVYMGNDTIGTVLSKYSSDFQVFQSAMKEIKPETVELVIELSNSKSILNGIPQIPKLEKILKFLKEYHTIPKEKQELWCWVNSRDLPIAKFKNELIGTLCIDIQKEGL